MASDINKITIVGRLTKDPEMSKTTTGTSICKFSIANNEYTGKDKDDHCNFFDVVLWGARGETFGKFTSKGSQVILTGRIKNERFQSKDGKNQSKVYIVCEDFQFIGSKKDSAKEPSNAGGFTEADFGANNSEVPF